MPASVMPDRSVSSMAADGSTAIDPACQARDGQRVSAATGADVQPCLARPGQRLEDVPDGIGRVRLESNRNRCAVGL